MGCWMKKIIYTLLIILLIESICMFSKTNASDTGDFETPQSYTNSEEAFNQLLNGQATITSDDQNSTNNSQLIGIGNLNNQTNSAAGALTSTVSIIPFLINKVLSFIVNGGNAILNDSAQTSSYFTIGELLTNKYPLFNINMFEETPPGVNSELSNVIKENVASWYVGLRNLAVVGCIIILLYVGIRMAISSTADESAKYKNMLMNWLIGVILLFIMQYIILAMIKASEIFINFINTAIEKDTDTIDMELMLLTAIPSKTYKAEGWGKLVYLTLNCVLVYYELKFFILYFFRVLKIFIMTIISPLICITYPLDTLGDGRAQAFNNWFKELMITIFLQPMHLIIYIVFIYSAGEIAKEAPIIGLIFIIALDSSEKIIRSALKIKGSQKGLMDIKIFKGKGK